MLRGGAPIERAAAAVTLAQAQACTTEELYALVALGDPDLTAVAAWSLAQLESPDGVGCLVSMLEGVPEPAAELAAEVLWRTGWKPDTATSEAAFAVARRNWDRCAELGAAAVPFVIRAASDDREWLRQHAVRTLARLPGLESHQVLRRAMSDWSPRVRAEASRALRDEPCLAAKDQRRVVASDQNPIFIVGAARSGTTLVRLLLTTHPRIAIPPEGDFLVELADRLAGHPLTDADRADFIGGFFELDKCREWGVERATLQTRIEAAAPSDYASLAAIPYQLYGERNFGGKDRWGDKHPHYAFHLPLLLRLYPRARVLEVVRDAKDVAASVIPLPFGPRTAAGAAIARARALRAVDATRKRKPDRVLRVCYEELVIAPGSVTRQICDFIGEPHTPDMLLFHEENRRRGLVPE
ncbi:MAG: sulfotransferase, partial [Myxococcota bacterium]